MNVTEVKVHWNPLNTSLNGTTTFYLANQTLMLTTCSFVHSLGCSFWIRL